MSRILVVGNIATDFIMFATEGRFPSPEESIEISRPIVKTSGGMGGNCAVALKKWKCDVHLFTKVGEDEDKLIKFFSEKAIDTTRWIIRKNIITPNCLSFVQNNERSFYFYPGMNCHISLQDFSEYMGQDFNRYDIIHFTGIGNQSNQDGGMFLDHELPVLLDSIRKQNSNIIFSVDFAPVKRCLSDVNWQRRITEFIKRINILFASEYEAKILANYGERGHGYLQHSYHNIAESLFCKYCSSDRIAIKRCICIKTGGSGCFLYACAPEGLSWEVVVPPKQGRIVDKTGAGDVFCAGFLSSLSRHRNIPFSSNILIQAARSGHCAAFYSLAEVGAVRNIPEWEVIERDVENYPEDNAAAIISLRA